MCITLNISRSSYYEKSTRKISKTEIRREEIKKEVKSIFKDSINLHFIDKRDDSFYENIDDNFIQNKIGEYFEI